MAKSSVVVDANFAIKTVLANEMFEQCREALDYLVHHGYQLEAPTLWAYETTSAICKAVHFKYLTEDEGWRTLDQLALLRVTLRDPEMIDNRSAFTWTRKLNRAAAYDSYYLALAEALGCELWTADLRLVKNVDLPWVRWVGDTLTSDSP